MITWEEILREDRTRLCGKGFRNPSFACVRRKDHGGECHPCSLTSYVVDDYERERVSSMESRELVDRMRAVLDNE